MWVDGRPRAVGEVVSMSPADAAYAIHIGRAAAVVEAPVPVEAPAAKPKRGAKAGDVQ